MIEVEKNDKVCRRNNCSHDYLIDGVEIARVAKKLGVTTMTKEEARAHIEGELARKGF